MTVKELIELNPEQTAYYIKTLREIREECKDHPGELDALDKFIESIPELKLLCEMEGIYDQQRSDRNHKIGVLCGEPLEL